MKAYLLIAIELIIVNKCEVTQGLWPSGTWGGWSVMLCFCRKMWGRYYVSGWAYYPKHADTRLPSPSSTSQVRYTQGDFFYFYFFPPLAVDLRMRWLKTIFFFFFSLAPDLRMKWTSCDDCLGSRYATCTDESSLMLMMYLVSNNGHCVFQTSV